MAHGVKSFLRTAMAKQTMQKIKQIFSDIRVTSIRKSIDKVDLMQNKSLYIEQITAHEVWLYICQFS